MRFHLEALANLIHRYTAVWRAWWAIRDQLDAPEKLRHELAFQPAQLELVETPIHPAPRWTVRILMVLAILILLIAIVGRLDIEVTALGKFVPNERVKIIQPAITGVVRQIMVRDGQRVSSGQVLLVLDATQAAADADKARSSRVDAALASARATALLDAVRTGRLPTLTAVAGASSEQHAQAQHFAEGLYREYADKLLASQAELLKREAELATTRQEVEKLHATAPLARREADDYRHLALDQYVAQHDYLSKERTALEQEHELAAEQSHARELAAGIAEQRAAIGQTTSQFAREQLDVLDKARQQFAQYSADESKAATRQGLMTLYAPVSGTVEQLATHTPGGVVTTAQSIMEIVPDDAVEVEASIENKDVGFVNVGQDAVVKIEAFPHTRYGYLTGKVISISNDSAQNKDRKLGLTFTAHIRLPTNQMQINDQPISLTPGMEVTAEIRTGRRSVAGYFLDPLMQTAGKSLHER
ncbi:MAG: RTX toxin transporter, determinant D [uncultured Paraburkholderia sp.]|uniref:HlyD family type I secretion periplasmic adaptor subunit n=1 Tax=uncultured Paraburkholderia sp. TaxID=1822466 RepID=UPI00259382D2|nr:HlyD family type I secretion periplasmic adaptor subunit [uncultured Paraburkholderia sp.]CAH2895884.1 MAG: RTX toxin transporter, determinant D [uncultured Paraburkholderia sp.]CAH2919018.1 MAG: RTX toxin transporter, determinant D [uncultured Paraburkholderia sp.]